MKDYPRPQLMLSLYKGNMTFNQKPRFLELNPCSLSEFVLGMDNTSYEIIFDRIVFALTQTKRVIFGSEQKAVVLGEQTENYVPKTK